LRILQTFFLLDLGQLKERQNWEALLINSLTPYRNLQSDLIHSNTNVPGGRQTPKVQKNQFFIGGSKFLLAPEARFDPDAKVQQLLPGIA
jgi:hypothetical protein